MTRTKAPLKTATKVEEAEAGFYRIDGAPGLYFKRGSVGAGSYFFRYSRAGERVVMGLGSAETLTLAEAKAQAIEFTVQRNKGVDPEKERECKRAAARIETKAVTFAEAAEAYVVERAGKWRGKYASGNWINPIIKYAYPVIGRLPLDAIEAAHVRAILKAASKARPRRRKALDQDRDGGTARRVRQRIGQILAYAASLGQRSATVRNPADADLHKGFGGISGAVLHYRRIEDLDAAPEAFRAILKGAESDTRLAAWAFMILTAARGSEALKARWGEIDLNKRLWTIPAARMKSNREHVVPLSSLALAILERQAKVRSDDSVFPGSGGAPLSYNAFAVAVGKASVDAGTPHSWRSVFRAACVDRLRIDRDLAEAALSHTLGAVEGAYRRETAIEARRPVMEAYANWLLDEGAKVIAFPVARN